MGREHGPAVNAKHIQRSRPRVDAWKLMMGKAAPKKCRDKVVYEVANKDFRNLAVQIVHIGGKGG